MPARLIVCSLLLNADNEEPITALRLEGHPTGQLVSKGQMTTKITLAYKEGMPDG